jgi:hypothetical protein
MWVSMLMLFSMSLQMTGCSRSFWRGQADKDTYRAIDQKQVDGRWQVPRTDIAPDVDSRFFDQYDPDNGPLPPDDPAAAVYMKCANGMPGYKSWHKMGQAMSVENPQWLAPFCIDPTDIDPDTGEYKGNIPSIKNMTLSDAIELSYIHSRNYQTQIEDLYLAALALTFERFRFQVRYLGIGGQEPSTDATFQSIPNGQNSLNVGSQFGVSQLLPSGGQWLVGLTNNTLWLFSGNNRATSASVLSFSLVQPFLNGAGRKVAMETLTQAERDVLYQVRALARYRKTLFSTTVSGSGAGLGYLDLLETLQNIRNQQGTVRLLEERVESLRESSNKPAGGTPIMFERLPDPLVVPELLQGKIKIDRPNNTMIWKGDMTEEQAKAIIAMSDDPEFQRGIGELVQMTRNEVVSLDVAQLETSLRNSQNSLRSREISLKTSMDVYKISLGLPPDIVVTLDDSLLEQFQFIDPKLTDMEQRIKDYTPKTAELNEDMPDLDLMRTILAGLFAFHQEVQNQGVAFLENDAEHVLKRFEASRQDPAADQGQIDFGMKALTKNKESLENIKSEIKMAENEIKTIAQQLQLKDLNPQFLKELIGRILGIRDEIRRLCQSLQVLQINFRVELITLNDFDLTLDQCVGLALENRMDLMNAKADVVDARRKVEVAANRLKGIVNMVVEGDIATKPGGNNPVDFRGSSSSYRAGVAVTAPLDQAANRNVYRESLITYQRARRNYMLIEDTVKADVRASWRQLKVLQINLETAREALRFAAIEYDQAVQLANAPTRPGQSAQGGVQGRNLTSAINDVLSAENALIGIWVDYERLRINIYKDMDIMMVDPQGIWEDKFYQEQSAKGHLGKPEIPSPHLDEVIPLQNNNVPPAISSDLKSVSAEEENTDVLPIAGVKETKGLTHEFTRVHPEEPGHLPSHAKVDGPHSRARTLGRRLLGLGN